MMPCRWEENIFYYNTSDVGQKDENQGASMLRATMGILAPAEDLRSPPSKYRPTPRLHFFILDRFENLEH